MFHHTAAHIHTPVPSHSLAAAFAPWQPADPSAAASQANGTYLSTESGPWTETQLLARRAFVQSTSKPITPELDSILESEEEQSPPPYTQVFSPYQPFMAGPSRTSGYSNPFAWQQSGILDTEAGMVGVSDAAPFQYAAPEFVKHLSSLHGDVSQQTSLPRPDYYSDQTMHGPPSPRSDARPSSSGTFDSFSQLYYYSNSKGASDGHSLPPNHDMSEPVSHYHYSHEPNNLQIGLSGELIPSSFVQRAPLNTRNPSQKRTLTEALDDPVPFPGSQTPNKRVRRPQDPARRFSPSFGARSLDESHYTMPAAAAAPHLAYSDARPAIVNPPVHYSNITPGGPKADPRPPSGTQAHGRGFNVVFVSHYQGHGNGYQTQEMSTFEHGPTDLPPRQYPGGNYAVSPLKPPKSTGKIPGSAMDYLPILEDRFFRLESAISRYVELRAERALRNSILPGLSSTTEDGRYSY